MAPIRGDHKVGMDFEQAARRPHPDAFHFPALLDELEGLRLHFEAEAGVAPSLFGDEIQEIPLGHEGDEFAVGGQMREVGDGHPFFADLHCDAAQLLMRPLEEGVEYAKLVHDLQSGRVNGVAAEITQEVRVLLENDHLDSGADKKVAEHHPCRAAAGNAAAGFDHVRRGSGGRHRGGSARESNPRRLSIIANYVFSEAIEPMKTVKLAPLRTNLCRRKRLCQSG